MLEKNHQISDVRFDAWAQSSGVGAVYLFGSVARGRQRADSDVDVALWLRPEPADWEAREIVREQAVNELARVLEVPRDRLDVCVLNDAPLAFQHRVVTCRRCLWERDHGARIELDVHTALLYEDYRYFEDMHYDAMRRRLREGKYGRRPTPHRAPPA